MSEKIYGVFPAQHKQKFISDLEKNGARIVLFPDFTAEIIDLDKSLIENLQDFDWLFFQDVFTADIFLEKLKKTNFDLYEFDNFRIVAGGEAVADRLRFEQIHSDIIPTKIFPGEIFQAISDYQTDLQGVKFLILTESEREVGLSKFLKNAGAKVSEVAVYSLMFEEQFDLPKMKALVKGGAIDKIVFSSPEEIIAFRHIFAAENLAEILAETEISAMDEVTRKAIWEFGM